MDKIDRIKKFLNSKSLPNWILLIFVIALIILAAFGWRITYDPQLENSWGAIDAVGGWISAVISGVAIWFAVSAPKQIAQEQNSIALFEMRYLSYSVFLKYTSFAEVIQSVDAPDQLRRAFSFNFMEFGSTVDSKELISIIKNDEKQLMSGLFLFSNFCDGKTIHDILHGVLEVANLLQYEGSEFSEDDKSKVMSFCNICNSFSENYMGEMRRQLTIRDV